jgi:hypothetical protein
MTAGPAAAREWTWARAVGLMSDLLAGMEGLRSRLGQRLSSVHNDDPYFVIRVVFLAFV